MNILNELASLASKRCEEMKSRKSLDELRSEALSLPERGFEFEKKLRGSDISFICEVKKASPSKGEISTDFPYLEIAREYQSAGADCISVLTEPFYFKGSNNYLKEISSTVSVPVIRKDFTVDEYMIYEAATLGASAVLLICALLDTDVIKRYIGICDKLGLSALVEAHNEKEIRSALDAGARVIGVNNRDLRDFTVDINNSVKLRGLVPSDIFFVAESGIKTSDDIDLLRNAGVNAVLIGETLMRSGDKKNMIRDLRGY